MKKSNHLPILFTSAFLALAFIISPVFARDVPQLTGRVNDYAGLLSQQSKANLEEKLAELEKSDSTQVVILTINSLEGEEIAQYGIKVADTWKIGQKGKDNGAIFIIAKDDRKMRIEVGYGLEGKLTDLMSGRILDNVARPNFRNGDYDKGITDATDAIIGVVKGEYTADQTFTKKNKKSSSGLFVFIFGIIFVLAAINKWLSAAGCSIIAPITGAVGLKMGFIGILASIPVGFLLGLLLGVIFKASNKGRHFGGHHGSGFGGFGGFGGGGGSSFGGFSGGGGGFGGGGASSGW